MSRLNPKVIRNRVDLTNRDIIGMAGDSYTEGMYYIKGKAWVCRFSELTDYNVESIGEGGITCAGLATKIKNNTPRFHATLGWQDFKPTYAMLMSFVNDMATGSTNSETFQLGMLELIRTVREYGAEPIVCTEFRRTWGTGLEAGLAAMCDDEGLRFWNILDYCEALNNKNNTDSGGYVNFWNGSHPGTRTGFVILDQYLRYGKTLPRPKQSLKIFRKLSGVTVNTLADLLYSDVHSRMKLFKEINVGHSGLKVNTNYDNVDAIGASDFEAVNSDYLTIQGGGSVSFSDYAVVECVLPATRPNVQRVTLNLSDSGATVYILRERVWSELTGRTTTDLDGCVDYDKVRFLVYKSGGFSLTSISVDWEGVEGKELNVGNRYRAITSGTEIMTNTLFANNTGRTVVGTLTASDTADGLYPCGATKIVNIDADNYFRQTIPNDGTLAGVTTKVKVRVAARYYPTEGTADINAESYDWADLKLQIKGQLSGGTTTTYYSVTKHVGLHWTMIEMDIDLPQGNADPELTVRGVDKAVQVAYVSAVKS